MRKQYYVHCTGRLFEIAFCSREEARELKTVYGPFRKKAEAEGRKEFLNRHNATQVLLGVEGRKVRIGFIMEGKE